MKLNGPAKFPLSPEIRSRLEELYQQLSSSAAKRLLWTKLTPQEQRTIDTELVGSALDFEPSAVGIWTYLRDVDIEPGTVDLAARLGVTVA